MHTNFGIFLEGCQKTLEGAHPPAPSPENPSLHHRVSQDSKTGHPKIFLGVAKYFRERGRTKSVLGCFNRNCSYKTHVLERQCDHCIFKQRFQIVHICTLCEDYYNGCTNMANLRMLTSAISRHI